MSAQRKKKQDRNERPGRRKRLRIALAAALLLTAALLLGTGLYLSDYYHAEKTAMEILEHPAQDMEILREKDRIVFRPKEVRAGLIFYPGGKVEYEAYAPLMEQCARRGILCVLCHMPGNLAVFDSRAAEGIQEEYPEAERWYLAGHSLGGAMAASYASEHAAEYQGLILLAAYSTKDLKNSGLEVLSIYGSEDKVLKMDSYEKYKENLPGNFSEEVIEGGCHAYFGAYGSQDKDGVPTISQEEQTKQTADLIAGFVLRQES